MTRKPISQTLDDERPRPDSPDAATFHHHLARYQFALERLAGGERILDAGCGTGYGTALLAERGGYALGFDYSPLAIEYARAVYAGDLGRAYRLAGELSRGLAGAADGGVRRA